MFGDVRQDEIRGDRRDLIETRLAKLAFDIVLRGEAEAAMRLETHVGRLPRRLRGEILRHVRLGAARLVSIEQRARFPAHQVSRLDLHVALGDWKLHALVLPNRTVEDDALVRVRRRSLDEPASITDALGGNERT